MRDESSSISKKVTSNEKRAKLKYHRIEIKISAAAKEINA